jgi:hypothetical protein
MLLRLAEAAHLTPEQFKDEFAPAANLVAG